MRSQGVEIGTAELNLVSSRVEGVNLGPPDSHAAASLKKPKIFEVL